MKKIHSYEVMYYSWGGWLERITVKASSKAEALQKTREQYKVISIYRVRYIG